jgi:hypothetical protein
MKSLFSFFALLLAAATASALEWKTQRLSLKAAALDHTAQTAFDFTNTSDRTVTIKSVDTSCDCLDAVASAKTFPPGAGGQIIARFTLGDRFGSYSRTIIVSTDDGKEPAALTVEIEVPEAATLTPRVLEWKLDAPATAQAVEVGVTSGVELTIDDVTCTSDAYQFRLETLEAGRRYRLHISPKSTHAVANAAFRLNAKTAAGREVVLSAYANVR